jgi:hypothetical protein
MADSRTLFKNKKRESGLECGLRNLFLLASTAQPNDLLPSSKDEQKRKGDDSIHIAKSGGMTQVTCHTQSCYVRLYGCTYKGLPGRMLRRNSNSTLCFSTCFSLMWVEFTTLTCYGITPQGFLVNTEMSWKGAGTFSHQLGIHFTFVYAATLAVSGCTWLGCEFKVFFFFNKIVSVWLSSTSWSSRDWVWRKELF